MASIAAMGSGSVTSPMPQRISLLAASGWDSANAFTRAPYFREQISRLQLEEVIVNVRHGFNSKRLIPYPERDGIKAPFRHAVLPCVTKRRSFPPCRSFRRVKAAAPALLRVHAPRRHPVLPDSPELLPGKIPKNGQADAQQGNLFILRGIMALKKPASFVPVLRQSCF